MYAKERRVPPSRNSRLTRIGRTGREGTAIFIPSSLLRSVDLLCTRTRAYSPGCTCRMNSRGGDTYARRCVRRVSFSFSLLFSVSPLRSRREAAFGSNESVSFGPLLCLSPRSLAFLYFFLHCSLALSLSFSRFSISSFVVLLHLILCYRLRRCIFDISISFYARLLCIKFLSYIHYSFHLVRNFCTRWKSLVFFSYQFYIPLFHI